MSTTSGERASVESMTALARNLVLGLGRELGLVTDATIDGWRASLERDFGATIETLTAAAAAAAPPEQRELVMASWADRPSAGQPSVTERLMAYEDAAVAASAGVTMEEAAQYRLTRFKEPAKAERVLAAARTRPVAAAAPAKKAPKKAPAKRPAASAADRVAAAASRVAATSAASVLPYPVTADGVVAPDGSVFTEYGWMGRVEAQTAGVTAEKSVEAAKLAISGRDPMFGREFGSKVPDAADAAAVAAAEAQAGFEQVLEDSADDILPHEHSLLVPVERAKLRKRLEDAR